MSAAPAPASLNPLLAVRSLVRHRALLLRFVRREVTERYRGSMLGVLWSLATPILMLGVYGLVFGVVFQARWNTGDAAAPAPHGEFAVMLFSGLILHAFLVECLTRAPGVILEQRNLVKKVVFPLELLPATVVGAALFQLFISLGVLLLAALAVYHRLPVTALWLPALLLPFVMLATGCAWALAALGVYLRDTGHVMGITASLLLFLSTVFYPASRLPAPLDALIYLNPLSFMVDQLRAVIVTGAAPDSVGLLLYTAVATVLWAGGFALFQKARRGFADVV